MCGCWCVVQGYTKLMSVLGANLAEFLQNLNNLHLHLSYCWPDMVAPAFRCEQVSAGMLHSPKQSRLASWNFKQISLQSGQPSSASLPCCQQHNQHITKQQLQLLFSLQKVVQPFSFSALCSEGSCCSVVYTMCDKERHTHHGLTISRL